MTFELLNNFVQNRGEWRNRNHLILSQDKAKGLNITVMVVVLVVVIGLAVAIIPLMETM